MIISTPNLDFRLVLFFLVSSLRIVFHLADFSQMIIDIIDPIALFNENVLGCHSIDNSPLIDKLADVSNLWGDRWDTKSLESPIILIASDSLCHSVIWVSKLLSIWEGSLFLNFLENIQNSWSPCFNIVLLNTIERPNKCITIRMHVDNKFDFVLMLCQKVSVCLSFRLWEWLLAVVEHRARITCCYFLLRSFIIILDKGLIFFSCILFVDPIVFSHFDEVWMARWICEIHWEVPVQINSLDFDRLFLKLSQTLSRNLRCCVPVLSNRGNSMVFIPVLFNQSQSIDIQCRYEIESVITE